MKAGLVMPAAVIKRNTLNKMDKGFVLDKLELAYQKRSSLLKVTDALRVVNGTADGLDGLVLEQYANHYAIHLYKGEWQEQLDIIKSWLLKRFAPAFIIVKNRTESSGRILDNPKVDILLDITGSKTIINEYDMKFHVDLNDTVNSGLFLDMRSNRKLVGDFSKGKAVLNCFAYTCSFGIYAKKNGCQLVHNVDISSKNLKKGEDNYRINGFGIERADFVRSDVQKYMEGALKRGNLYDLVIIDPPSFSRFGRKVFQIKRDLSKLLDICLKILKPQGTVFVSTNYSGIGNDYLVKIVRKSSQALHKSVKDIQPLGQDIDFPPSGRMKESSLAAILVSLR